MSWFRGLFPARPGVGPERARQLLEAGAILLDVREHAEWRAGHAPGARHIPLSLAARPGQRTGAAAHRDNRVPFRPPVRGSGDDPGPSGP